MWVEVWLYVGGVCCGVLYVVCCMWCGVVCGCVVCVVCGDNKGCE